MIHDGRLIHRVSSVAMSSNCKLLAFCIVVLACGCSKPELTTAPTPVDLEFVGSEACQTCHGPEYSDWQGSHHQLAMQVADRDTVLGDFSDKRFDYFETSTHFLTKGDKFLVRTENADGEQQEFSVTHTFGVTPLQQYLIEFPGGRLQALPFAWDSRPEESGGQRWFHLYPEEYIGPGDPLHWTGRNFNWNYMCAECHSTDVKLGYDADSRTFNTTYEEISVGCESCHGPGSTHVVQANAHTFESDFGLQLSLDDQRGAAWIMDPATGMAKRSELSERQQQPESCGRCHSRRSVIAPDYEYGRPLTDTHMPSLLEEHLYFADGQIQDEVYVYGSFLQSRMHGAGVSCSDCHNPHSGQLVTGPDPNNVCGQCHLASRFATSAHGESESQQGQCVDCHMPARTYMGVDDRRDHSFRIIKPDADAHYGTAIAAGRAGSANEILIAAATNPDYQAIVRATMLSLLEPRPGEDEIAAIQAGLGDEDPLVRIAALRALRQFPAEHRFQFDATLLDDPVRGVRLEAVLVFADLVDLLPVTASRSFVSAADEYRETMRATANRPESLVRLAEFESTTGNAAAAAEYFEKAIELDPAMAVARHAYGLLLVRLNRHDDALQELGHAAEIEPTNSRYVYVFGVALNSLGQPGDAMDVLRQARVDFPHDFDIAWALATMLRDAGDIPGARQLVDSMAEQFPDNDAIESLRSTLPE